MSDDALIHQFSRERSETAFAALVERHLQIVFATALRQTGDRQLAEEIAQNVFLALARKAGRLGGHHTVAGWLYQATLKEAKLALRTRLRRERREQVAIESGKLHRDEDLTLAGLLPLLDEALANLREPERLAVILRYLEEKSWKEVGELLGLTEEAARKRAERALDGLGQFFSRHGFKVSIATLATGMTGQAGAAVPIALAGTVTQAAIAKTATASGVGILLGHFMNLTKTQTTIATLLVCAAPIAYEANATRENEHATAALSPQLIGLHSDLESAEANQLRLANQLAAMGRTLADLSGPPPAITNPPEVIVAKPVPLEPVGWRDDLSYVEVPKSLLREIGIPTIGLEGTLQEAIIDALAMTPDESSSVQELIQHEVRRWTGIEAASARYEPAFRPHLEHDENNEMLSYRFPPMPDQAVEAKERMNDGLASILGTERAELFVHHSTSIAHLTDGKGHPERVVTLERTGNPDLPVKVTETEILPNNGSGSSSYRLGNTNENLAYSLMNVPEFMRPIAIRWIYNDRAR